MAVSVEEMNLFQRNRLNAVGQYQSKDLGTTSLNLGGTTRIKLQNIGITHRLRLLFNFAYTIGTATATLSPFGFLNAVTRIQVIDFDGQSRINASAATLFMRNCVRERRIDGAIRDSLAGIGGSTAYGTAGVTIPNAGLTAAAQTAQFFLDVPLAVDSDAGDLRGAIATQSTVGEVYLVIDCVAGSTAGMMVNGDDTKVFNGAATTTVASVTATVQVLQEYVMPQPDRLQNGALPMPQLDLLTVYEIISLPTSDNLAASQEKLISLPNSRWIMGVGYRYFHNSLQGGSSTTNDISRHRLLLNGSTAVMDRVGKDMSYMVQRQELGIDIGKGAYFFDFVGLPGNGRQPIETAQLGNIQIGVTPASSPSGTTYLEYFTESLYTKGSMLGSIIPNS